MPKPPFLGRTKELKAFRQTLDEIKEQESDLPYVFLLYGQGGIPPFFRYYPHVN